MSDPLRGWETLPLGKVADVTAGQSPKGEFYNDQGQGLPFYQGKKEFGEKYIGSPTKWTSVTTREAEESDILMSVRAPVGPINFATQKICIGRGLAGIRANPDRLDRSFLYYALLDKQDEIKGNEGAVFASINKKQIQAIEISLPPLSEQRRLVGLLDAAFARLATATAHTQKNLTNARELFDTHLNQVFSHEGSIEDTSTDVESPVVTTAPKQKGKGTRTGGRAATDQHIPGPLSLSVNRPKTPAKSGWSWRCLTDIARLETGHTPSRRHPEWWGGDIPWVGIKDAKANHGQTITETLTCTNEGGIANSAARVLPNGTVCLSRTASVGYVTVMGKEMATSQDFVNWVCSDQLEPHFLKYLLLAEGDGIRRFGSGSVHTTIYFPEVKAFYVCCPDRETQSQIVKRIDRVREQSKELGQLAERKLTALEELKHSLLHRAFRGELSGGAAADLPAEAKV